MKVIQKSYELSSQVQAQVKCPSSKSIKSIKYFTDCVFKPRIYCTFVSMSAIDFKTVEKDSLDQTLNVPT